MSLQRIVLNLPSQTAQDFKDMVNLAPGMNQAIINLGNFFRRLAGGNSYGVTTVNVGAVQASGTATFDTVIATDVFTVNGQAFTCVASGAGANQFNVGVDDSATAANAVAAVNASSNSLGIYTASAVGPVITITADVPGLIGNAITLATSDSTIVVSGARLTGGTDGTEYEIDLS